MRRSSCSSVWSSRALIVGIIYLLLWEGLITSLIPGAGVLSIRHYTQSIFVRLLHDASVTLKNPMQLGSALIVLGLVTLISLVLATLRLRQMSLD